MKGARPPLAPSAFGLTLDLLSRPLSPGEIQIVKPTNAANVLIPEILHARPDAKALLLYSDLDTFLRAILRRGAEGRMVARQYFRGFATAIPLEPGFSLDTVLLQTDLQIAAQAWLMQIAFMHSIAQRYGDRVRILDCKTFLADRPGTLDALSTFFGLGLSEQQITGIVQGPALNENAKIGGVLFNEAVQREKDARINDAYGEELSILVSRYGRNVWRKPTTCPSRFAKRCSSTA